MKSPLEQKIDHQLETRQSLIDLCSNIPRSTSLAEAERRWVPRRKSVGPRIGGMRAAELRPAGTSVRGLLS